MHCGELMFAPMQSPNCAGWCGDGRRFIWHSDELMFAPMQSSANWLVVVPPLPWPGVR